MEEAVDWGGNCAATVRNVCICVVLMCVATHENTFVAGFVCCSIVHAPAFVDPLGPWHCREAHKDTPNFGTSKQRATDIHTRYHDVTT